MNVRDPSRLPRQPLQPFERKCISRDIIRIALLNSLRDGERKRVFVYCVQGFAFSVGTDFMLLLILISGSVEHLS